MNKRFLFSLIMAVVCPWIAYSTEITVEIPESVISRSPNSVPIDINDHDEVLLSLCPSTTYETGNHGRYAIWRKGQPLEIFDDGNDYHKLGNDETLLGFSRDGGYAKPFTWTRPLELQHLNLKQYIPDFSSCLSTSVLLNINDNGSIIGNYATTTQKNRVFIWENGAAQEFLPDDLVPEGFEPVNVTLIATTSKGRALGSFEYGHKHPLKQSLVIDGTKYFLWNKKSYIINLPPETDPSKNTTWSLYDLNDNNEVLLRKCSGPRNEGSARKYSNSCYIWTPDQNLSLIVENFIPIKFNNRRQIIGVITPENPVEDGECIMGAVFSQGTLIEIGPAIKSYGYSCHSLKDINNEGTILCHGEVWGELHAFTIHIPYNE